MDDLIKLKKLLNINNNEKNDILEFIFSNVKEIILNYCHISKIPKELNNTVLRMCVDIYKYEGIGEDEIKRVAKSVKEGDVLVDFSLSSEVIKDTILNNYRVQLNRFRKLVW